MTATTVRHAQAQPSLPTVSLSREARETPILGQEDPSTDVDEESDPAQVTTESPSLGGPVAVRGPSGPPFDRDWEGKTNGKRCDANRARAAGWITDKLPSFSVTDTFRSLTHALRR